MSGGLNLRDFFVRVIELGNTAGGLRTPRARSFRQPGPRRVRSIVSGRSRWAPTVDDGFLVISYPRSQGRMEDDARRDRRFARLRKNRSSLVSNRWASSRLGPHNRPFKRLQDLLHRGFWI
jgi:hypothetical protein